MFEGWKPYSQRELAPIMDAVRAGHHLEIVARLVATVIARNRQIDNLREATRLLLSDEDTEEDG
jgi:hypothetical protein